MTSPSEALAQIRSMVDRLHAVGSGKLGFVRDLTAVLDSIEPPLPDDARPGDHGAVWLPEWNHVWIVVHHEEGSVVYIDKTSAVKDQAIFEENSGSRGLLVGPFVLARESPVCTECGASLEGGICSFNRRHGSDRCEALSAEIDRIATKAKALLGVGKPLKLPNGEEGEVIDVESWLLVRVPDGGLRRVPSRGTTACGSAVEYVTSPAAIGTEDERRDKSQKR